MFGLNLEPIVYCLFASLLWAPIVYIAATQLDHDRKPAISELIWLGALGVAVLPTILAPALAAAGLSLRPAPSAAPIELTADQLLLAAAALSAEQANAAPVLSFDAVMKALGLLYIYGVVLAFLVWLARALTFANHVSRAQPIEYPELREALEDWRQRLGVTASVRIKRSDVVSSVCVYGMARPVILVPNTLDARVSFDDLVLMGAHELAHVKRGDCIFFAVCSISRVFFWFNPFVKRVAARAELAAERSADRMVLRAGADRRAYAACFVEGLRFAVERARETHAAVPSFTPFDKRSRRERLDAILSGKDEDRSRPSKIFMVAAVTSAAALAFAQAAFAVDPETRKTTVTAEADLPVRGEITLAYGETINGDIGAGRPAHEGIDIKAAKGAPIKAPADGVVVEATDVYKGKPSWGKVVVIRHKNGVTTRYAHLDSYSVKRGERVKAGDVIAKVGDSGRVTGSHLHFETLVDGENADPMKALPKTVATKRKIWAVASLAPLAPTAPLADAKPAAPAPSVAPELAPAPEPAPLAEEVTPLPPLPKIADAADREVVMTFHSDDGMSTYVLSGDDGDSYAYGYAMSDEDRATLDESLKKMRHDIKKAKREYSQQMDKMRTDLSNSLFLEFDPDSFGAVDLSDLDLDEFDFDGLRLENFSFAPEELAKLSEKFSAEQKVAIERWRKENAEALKRAEAEIERAVAQAKRDRTQAMRASQRARKEAQRDIEQAQRNAERAIIQAQREQARREALNARAEAKKDREEARKDREEARREAQLELEEALRERARSLEEAQRDLNAERARIKEALKDIAEKRKQKKSGER